MRTHIANALQRRSQAIRNAVKHYNSAAVGIGRPTLDWAKVTHYTFLDQFNILQDTRHSVLDKEWADPVIRHLMKQHRRIQCAREEIVHCNIEIRRLHTSILDENKHFEEVLARLQGTIIWHPIQSYVRRRRAVNQLLLSRIYETHALPGFTGDRTPGIRKGSVQGSSAPGEMPPRLPNPDSDSEDDGEGDEELVDKMDSLVDFFSNLET